ncbi:uncharacterized protein LOC112604276 [Melanaphis sacchari]|uniref:uncharacterized protein LOC112604276 n=1 Tax=Melanaphis sacchari TaxID=742174 RepID=UPI000DC13C4F|nr:uncharacterized protein LOC112604276 [Melanaphis sacchari]
MTTRTIHAYGQNRLSNMRKCSIVGCKSRENNKKVTLFKVNSYNKIAWESVVNNAINSQFKSLKYICSEHFLPGDIITDYSIPFDVANRFVKRQIYELKKGAIPSVFKQINICKPSLITESFRKELFPIKNVTLKRNIDFVNPTVTNVPSKQICLADLQKSVFFNELINSLNLPIGWSTYIDRQIVILYKPIYKVNQLVIEKQIVINDEMSVNFYVYNVLIEPASLGLISLTYPINTKNLSEVIGSFNYKQVCQGGLMAIHFPGISIPTATNNNGIWRHKKCSLLLNRKKRCLNCDYLFPIFKKYKKRSMLINSKRIGPTLTPTQVHKNDLERDSIAPSRVCPKITHRHLAPDSFSKMNVKLATQIFSNSMAKEIEYYRCHAKIKSLENSEHAQIFIERMNSLFDALNRRHPAEGIKHNSQDFDVSKTI